MIASKLTLALALLMQQGGSLEIRSFSIDGGTARLAGGTLEVGGTGGANDAATLSGGTIEVVGGLWGGLCHGSIEMYGSGCPASSGLTPQFTISGCPEAGDVELFTISDATPGALALILLGFGQAQAPVGAGCDLAIQTVLPASIGPFPISAGGIASFQIPVPANLVSLVGLGVTHQVLVGDTTPLGFVMTNGAEVVLG